MKDARRKDSNAAREKGRKPENGAEKKRAKWSKRENRKKRLDERKAPKQFPLKAQENRESGFKSR